MWNAANPRPFRQNKAIRQVQALLDLFGSLRALRDRWLVIVGAVVLAALVTFLITPEQPRTAEAVSYTATATLLHSENSDGVFVSQARLERVALFAKTGEIPRLVAEEIGYEGDPAILASQITTTVSSTVGSITISSTGQDGERVAEVVNAFADTTVAYFSEQALSQQNARLTALEERLVEISGSLAQAEAALAANPNSVQLKAELGAQQDRYEQAYLALQDAQSQTVNPADLAILQRATPIPNSSSGGFVAPASRAARVALGSALGLALGLALALALERSEARIRTREDVESVLRVPVIAEVPKMSREERKKTAIAVVVEPLKAVADSYRNVRSGLLLMPSQPMGAALASRVALAEDLSQASEATAPRVVLVTSGHAREGKTTTVANLAASLAETGRKVLVLDADFRAPNMHNYLDVPEGLGLADHLSNPSGLKLKRLLRPTNVPGVRLLEAGTERDHPAVLASQMAPVIEEVRGLADIILIDSAPILHANDTLDLIPFVDTVLLVTRSGRLTRPAGQRVADFLTRLQAPVLGAVLVGSQTTPLGYGYGSYGYGYGYSGRSSADGANKRAPRHGRARRARANADEAAR